MDSDKRNRTSGAPGKKRKFGRRKKHRGFNKNSENVQQKIRNKRKRSTTSGKIKDISVEASQTRNRMIDINILFLQLEKFLVCATCKGQVKIVEEDIRGLGSKFNIMCKNCLERRIISTSKQVGAQAMLMKPTDAVFLH